ncbi:hypothetical protein [Moorena producens]|nr:hypothetical protein [Moorena producens]
MRQLFSTIPCSLFPVPDFCKKSNHVPFRKLPQAGSLFHAT